MIEGILFGCHTTRDELGVIMCVGMVRIRKTINNHENSYYASLAEVFLYCDFEFSVVLFGIMVEAFKNKLWSCWAIAQVLCKLVVEAFSIWMLFDVAFFPQRWIVAGATVPTSNTLIPLHTQCLSIAYLSLACVTRNSGGILLHLTFSEKIQSARRGTM